MHPRHVDKSGKGGVFNQHMCAKAKSEPSQKAKCSITVCFHWGGVPLHPTLD